MKIVQSLLVVAVLSASVWALPPQVEADKLALGAKASMDANDYASALDKLEKLQTLNVKLPDSYWYYYGTSLMKFARCDEAIVAFDKYLEKGQNAKFYKETLEKYDMAENLLRWQDDKDTVNLKVSQSKATKYCEDLVLKGKSNWRLPTTKELQALYLIKDSLKNLANSHPWYWSSSASGETVKFDDGHSSATLFYDDVNHVRCIRDDK